MIALQLVYRNPWNVLLAIVTVLVMAVFYLWSSQVLVVSRHGISFLLQTPFVAAAIVMALLAGIVVPILVYAGRQAVATSAQAGGSMLGAIFGAVSMTCCAPVILPAILSLLGFSGTTILQLNETTNRFWLPLAVAGIVLLSYSLISVVRSLNLQCRLNDATHGAGAEIRDREFVGDTVAERP